MSKDQYAQGTTAADRRRIIHAVEKAVRGEKQAQPRRTH